MPFLMINSTDNIPIKAIHTKKNENKRKESKRNGFVLFSCVRVQEFVYASVLESYKFIDNKSLETIDRLAINGCVRTNNGLVAGKHANENKRQKLLSLLFIVSFTQFFLLLRTMTKMAKCFLLFTYRIYSNSKPF